MIFQEDFEQMRSLEQDWVTNFNWGHYFWGLIWGQF